jgi:hypothetical protein
MRERADLVAAAGAICIVTGAGLRWGAGLALIAAGALLVAGALLWARADVAG